MRTYAAAFLVLTVLALAALQLYSRAPRQQLRHASLSLAQNEGAFLILSDIHFDPITGADPALMQKLTESPVEDWAAILSSQHQQWAAPGFDTNYALFSSTLDAARAAGQPYEYVLVTGDLLGHDFPQKYRHSQGDNAGYQDFAIKTMSFVSRAVQQAFPSLPVFFVFGNNDSILGDYAPPGARLLTAMQKEWKTVPQQAARKDFLAGGYYVAPNPTVPDAEFVVLNTSYFSIQPSPVPVTNEDSLELKWFQAQLDRIQLAHHSASILMHIPPGVDPTSAAAPGRCANPRFFWKKPLLDSFLAIVAAHKDILRDAFAGHTHINDFRVLTDDKGAAYFQVHIAPGVSRDHHSPSGFEIGVYDKKSGDMVDYAADFAHDPSSADPNPGWSIAYDFRQESHLAAYSPTSLETVALLIRSSDVIRSRIIHLSGIQNDLAVSAPLQNWRLYSCAQTTWDAASYGTCACPSGAGK